MNTTEILSALDSEISRLTKIRDLLSSIEESPRGRGRLPASLETQITAAAAVAPKRGRGRPKGSTNKSTSFSPSTVPAKRRKMSAAGRERIAAAQRARWAKQNGTAAATKPSTSKSATSKVEAKARVGATAKTAAKKATRGKVGRPRKAVTLAAPAKTAPKVTATAAKKKTVPAKTAKPAKKAVAKKAPAKQSAPGAEAAATRLANESNAMA